VAAGGRGGGIVIAAVSFSLNPLQDLQAMLGYDFMRSAFLAGGCIALAAGLLQAAPPGRAQDISPAAIADYQAKLAQYDQARQAYDAEADVYWNAVVEKRRARNAKRRDHVAIGLSDYVLTQPPLYTGPPRPISPPDSACTMNSVRSVAWV